jgi:hypothetical protein
MAHSEAQKRIINLGKQLVNELGLEPGVDTLSRWMAHYLADKMSLIENSQGKKRKLAEQECFETILKIWEHRQNLPSGTRPFEEFEPLLHLMSKIGTDDGNVPLFYRPDIIAKKPKIDSVDTKKIEGEDWLIIASQIDQTARVWLRHTLKQYANSVKKENTDEWLNNCVGLSDNEDANIIRIIFDEEDEMSDDEFQKKLLKEKLQRRIIELEKFQEINHLLLDRFKEELSEMAK